MKKKEAKIEPTERQKRFVELLVANSSAQKPRNKRQLLEAVGYKEGTLVKPSQVINSKGVRKLFEEAGLSANRIAKEWNKLVDTPTQEGAMSYKDKIQALSRVSELVLSISPDKQLTPQIQFIDKFLNLNELGYGRPRINQGKGIKKLQAMTIEEEE